MPLDGDDPVHLLLLKSPRILQTKHTVSHLQCRWDFLQTLTARNKHRGVRVHSDGFDKGVAESIQYRLEDLFSWMHQALEKEMRNCL